jgi:hypothetical protein
MTELKLLAFTTAHKNIYSNSYFVLISLNIRYNIQPIRNTKGKQRIPYSTNTTDRGFL